MRQRWYLVQVSLKDSLLGKTTGMYFVLSFSFIHQTQGNHIVIVVDDQNGVNLIGYWTVVAMTMFV